MTDFEDKQTPEEENGQEPLTQQNTAKDVPAEEEAGREPLEETPIEEAEDEDAEISLDGKADGDFTARYEHAKEKEVEKLTKEIEERNSMDTKAKKRNWWIKTVLMLVLISASIGMMFGLTSYFNDGDAVSFTTMVRNIHWPYFALLIAVILFAMLVESAKYSSLLKISTKKFYFRSSIKTMFLGKYYDGITPLGTGGQPFQIYYLHKKKVPAGSATAVPLVRYIVGTFVFCLTAVVLLSISPRFFSAAELEKANLTVRILAWIFMGVNLIPPVLILLVSVFPNFGKKLVMSIVKLLSKMHIVKHKYKVSRKYIYEINEYRNSMKFFAQKWWKLIPLVVLCILEVAAYLMLPFFVVIAIANVTPTADLLLHTCCLCMISYYSASLVPTPGNSGAVELSGSIVFITLGAAIKPYLAWVLLFWRFATYYVYIISGIGINIFEIIRGAVRNKRALKSQK